MNIPSLITLIFAVIAILNERYKNSTLRLTVFIITFVLTLVPFSFGVYELVTSPRSIRKRILMSLNKMVFSDENENRQFKKKLKGNSLYCNPFSVESVNCKHNYLIRFCDRSVDGIQLWSQQWDKEMLTIDYDTKEGSIEANSVWERFEGRTGNEDGDNELEIGYLNKKSLLHLLQNVKSNGVINYRINFPDTSIVLRFDIKKSISELTVTYNKIGMGKPFRSPCTVYDFMRMIDAFIFLKSRDRDCCFITKGVAKVRMGYRIHCLGFDEILKGFSEGRGIEYYKGGDLKKFSEGECNKGLVKVRFGDAIGGLILDFFDKYYKDLDHKIFDYIGFGRTPKNATKVGIKNWRSRRFCVDVSYILEKAGRSILEGAGYGVNPTVKVQNFVEDNHNIIEDNRANETVKLPYLGEGITKRIKENSAGLKERILDFSNIFKEKMKDNSESVSEKSSKSEKEANIFGAENKNRNGDRNNGKNKGPDSIYLNSNDFKFYSLGNHKKNFHNTLYKSYSDALSTRIGNEGNFSQRTETRSERSKRVKEGKANMKIMKGNFEAQENKKTLNSASHVLTLLRNKIERVSEEEVKDSYNFIRSNKEMKSGAIMRELKDKENYPKLENMFSVLSDLDKIDCLNHKVKSLVKGKSKESKSERPIGYKIRCTKSKGKNREGRNTESPEYGMLWNTGSYSGLHFNKSEEMPIRLAFSYGGFSNFKLKLKNGGNDSEKKDEDFIDSITSKMKSIREIVGKVKGRIQNVNCRGKGLKIKPGFLMKDTSINEKGFKSLSWLIYKDSIRESLNRKKKQDILDQIKRFEDQEKERAKKEEEEKLREEEEYKLWKEEKKRKKEEDKKERIKKKEDEEVALLIKEMKMEFETKDDYYEPSSKAKSVELERPNNPELLKTMEDVKPKDSSSVLTIEEMNKIIKKMKKDGKPSSEIKKFKKMEEKKIKKAKGKREKQEDDSEDYDFESP